MTLLYETDFTKKTWGDNKDELTLPLLLLLVILSENHLVE